MLDQNAAIVKHWIDNSSIETNTDITYNTCIYRYLNC